MAPAFVGVEVVAVGAEFVGLLGEGLGLFGGDAVGSLEDALDADVDGGVDEDVDDIVDVAQDVVGTASDDDTGSAVGELVDEVALGLVDAVGAYRGRAGVVGQGIVAEVKLEEPRDERRHALVVFLEVFGAEA